MNFWNPLEDAQEFIREWLNQLATDMVNGGIELVGDVITSPFDLSERFPQVDDLILGMQGIAGTMLMIFLYQRILQAMYSETVESEDVNYAKILGDTAIAAGLIASSPLLAQKISVAIADITKWVADFNIEYQSADDFFMSFSAGTEVAAIGLHMLLLFIVWGFAWMGLAISGGIRVALFGIGVIISPLVMAAYPINPGIVKQFFVSMIAVIMTQPFQMVCLLVGMGVASYGGFWGLLVSTAFFGIGIFGTVYLKNIIIPAGVSSGASGAAKMILYKLVRR
ncbi:hypothetical protein [Halobacillus massiliensis]|uniref:hypothetical protein n=1 Tax=Halobacillus massiliensis TaxID=1926286 RepID=UPI0009E31327|nr:hypothetical protein [Halobacillus massiliensis]